MGGLCQGICTIGVQGIETRFERFNDRFTRVVAGRLWTLWSFFYSVRVCLYNIDYETKRNEMKRNETKRNSSCVYVVLCCVVLCCVVLCCVTLLCSIQSYSFFWNCVFLLFGSIFPPYCLVLHTLSSHLLPFSFFCRSLLFFLLLVGWWLVMVGDGWFFVHP
jgi:hypothetical protein